jgi:rhamnosyltransferase
MNEPRVSILIPTCDGAATLRETLSAVAKQAAPFAFEVVAVDSGSTDETLAILEGSVDRLIQIERERFDHGQTRNFGVEACRGELVVLLVQDATPASETWLVELTRPLLDDRRLAGSFARQIPRPGASAITRSALQGWVACRAQPRTSWLGGFAELERLAPAERHDRCAFDNVCSCIRRSTWEAHRFEATPIAEDLAWAREVLLAGYGIAYAPDAGVFHSHERSVRYELWRTMFVHQRLHQLFGLSTIPSLGHLFQGVTLALVSHMRVLFRDHGVRIPPRQIARGLGLSVAWPLGQYLGGRAARSGRVLPRRGV